MKDLRITPATLADWPAIEAIYREGIRTGQATFQTEADVPDGPSWFVAKLSAMVFVAHAVEGVLGWIALSPVSSRCVYAGVAEISVYVKGTAQRHGVGYALMRHMIDASESTGIWTLEAGIFPENRASICLHEKVGFRVVGQRERIGKMDGVWRDVTLMERRSETIK
jgi:phosphinothricin acetyltransferase